jgi:hypothetical protein
MTTSDQRTDPPGEREREPKPARPPRLARNRPRRLQPEWDRSDLDQPHSDRSDRDRSGWERPAPGRSDHLHRSDSHRSDSHRSDSHRSDSHRSDHSHRSDTERPEPDGERRRPAGAGPSWRRWLAVPLLIFTGTRIAQFTILGWLVPPDSRVWDRLMLWDAGWFVRVAEKGYPHTYAYDRHGQITGNVLAFFPGYPLLIRLVHTITRLDYTVCALVISWLAAAIATVLIYRLGAALYDTRVATVFAVLFCVQPMSMVLSMGYSESLLLAFVTGALLAAYRRRWLLAGLLGLGAGLTRPNGAAVAVALLVAAIIHVVDRRNGPRRWWAFAGAALGSAGVPAYLLWVGWRIGELNAWFKIQSDGWGTSFDYGAAAVIFVRDSLRAGDGWVQVSVAFLLIAVVFSAEAAIRLRVWPPLIGYGLTALVLVLGQAGYYHSKPRLLVPVLLTLVPVAVAVARLRPRTAVLVLTLAGLFGLWYGAYLITVWPYAI